MTFWTPALIVFYCALHSFRIEWLTLASDFAALWICQQWPYCFFVRVFCLGYKLNTMHQYKFWNVGFVANFLCYNFAKYFYDRWTTHRIIAKTKRVPVFLKHSVVTLVLSYTGTEIRRLTGWKMRIFPTPLSFNAIARGEPFRISVWTFYRQTSVVGISVGEDFRDPSLRRFHPVQQYNRRRHTHTLSLTEHVTHLTDCNLIYTTLFTTYGR